MLHSSIAGPYTEIVDALIKLTNPLNQRVCFKVKTTAPKRYCIRPNNGVVEPNATQVVTVMFLPRDNMEPMTDKSKHKFMIQTLIEPEGCDDYDKIVSILKFLNTIYLTGNAILASMEGYGRHLLPDWQVSY